MSLLLVIFAIVTEKWSIVDLEQMAMSHPNLNTMAMSHPNLNTMAMSHPNLNTMAMSHPNLNTMAMSHPNLNTMAMSHPNLNTMAMSHPNLNTMAMSHPNLNTMAMSHPNLNTMAMSHPGLGALKIQKMEGSVSLWNVCGQINANITDDGEKITGGGIGCLNIPIKKWKNLPVSTLNACRVLAIISAFFLFSALICMNLDLRITSTILLILGSITCFVVCILWYTNFTKLTFDERRTESINLKIGYSFICNLVCGILTLISAVAFFLMTK